MKLIPQFLAVAALAAGSFLMTSCGGGAPTANTTPANSFKFDPPVTQPSNPNNVKIAISTTAQRLYVVEGDKVLMATPAAVGKASSPTPKGTHRILSKTKFRRRQSQPGRGYPMTYWMSFYGPAYGMHWGFVKPYPCTAGCVRMPLNSARKAFNLARVGTPVHVASSQPWDATIGAKLPNLDDSPLPDPPNSYMQSQQVFTDAEQGKMWNF
ncbi:L,D-transpeptidase [Roseibacillus ishigakijimensis]|uniref:L,D-transpeptidase n=1 Tax=Roseibacillus ishigakijimensis TaxID=454146 RepID=A0A934VM37_9BACT|nr:L,D-transpeptidase [Roseibacillus ishigakijimensis]MBK1833867.1 L,D-transpeptidase [Roseibacillus ishigakijimensis]